MQKFQLHINRNQFFTAEINLYKHVARLPQFKNLIEETKKNMKL